MAYDGGGEGLVRYEGGQDEEVVRIRPTADVVSERAAEERDPMEPGPRPWGWAWDV